MILSTPDGARWHTDPKQWTTTSDGFVLGYGFLLDEQDEPVHDEMNLPVMKQFFFGRADDEESIAYLCKEAR